MPYTVENGQVFFYDSRLRAADAKTFEILSEDFARDRSAVYVHRKRFPEGDPGSLVVLVERRDHPTRFAWDRRHVYKTNLAAIVKDLDGASFRALDPYYGSDRSLVYSFDRERVLKQADAKTFVVVGHGYAKDRQSVYFHGERVPGAEPGSFHALGPRVAKDQKAVFCDDRRLPGVTPATFRKLDGNYYTDGGGAVYHRGHPMPGARAAALEVIAPDYAKDDHAVYCGPSALEGAEPETFELLGAGYGRDRGRVFFANEIVEGADPESFVVANGTASDRHRVYQGPRGAEKVSSVEAAVGTGEMEAVAHALFARWASVLFPVFDSVKSNEWNRELESIAAVPDAAAAIPDLRIEIDGSWLRVTSGALSFEGSFAGYLTLMGALWGVARGKVLDGTPCVRMFDERGVSGPEGDAVIRHVTKILLEPTYELFALLSRARLEEEARLVLYQLMKVVEYDNSVEGQAVQQKLRQLVPESTLTDLSYYTLKGVTGGRASPQSFIKRLVQSPYLSSANTLERVRAAEFFHQNLGAVVYSNLLNFNKLVPPFVPLLEDPHPLVRDLMWQNLDFLVSKLFYEHAYRACLEYLPRLVERGINLELNLARRWECHLAFGEDEQATHDWQALEKIVSPQERAPAQHTGLHTDYPSFEFWQVAGYIRLAGAHRAWAEGKDPCEDVVIRKPKKPAEAVRTLHLQRADAFIGAAERGIERLARTYNAFEVGAALAELVVNLNELTRQWDYGRAASRYVMHGQYVEHALKKRAYALETVEVARRGVYRKDARGFFEHVRSADEIAPSLGDSWGIEYRLEGRPLSRTVPTKVEVHHQVDPGARQKGRLVGSHEAISYVGMNNAFYWTFETPDELKPGRWTITVMIDAKGPRPLTVEQAFLLHAGPTP